MATLGNILDGKSIAKTVRAEVKVRAEAFASTHGRAPCLHVVLVGDDPASQVYVRNKERAAKKASIAGEVHRLPSYTSMARLLGVVGELNQDNGIDGILVQLPLPSGLSDQDVIDVLRPDKDVDGLHPVNAGMLVVGRPALTACTPSGCMRLLQETGTELSGKDALVVGRSTLVGKPIAQLLLKQNCTVTMAHSRTQQLADKVAAADIVVAAVGREQLIKGAWIKEGAIVLDVGINRNADGKLVGDVEFESAKARASFITPVPGGVGPMTIAMLLSNTVDAAERRLTS